MWLIFRIFINLYYKLHRALIYPIFLLKTRGFGLIVSALLLYIVIQFVSAPDAPLTRTPSGPFSDVKLVQNHENGNSSFASDLLAQMDDAALKHYSQIYYWIMANQPAGQPHDWSYQNSHGRITPEAMFKNNYGHRCRRFSELLKVGATQQTLDGIACEKTNGTWCKLGKQFAPICGIGPRQGFGAWWDRTMRDLF